MARYIFVTGGVVSSLGKGLASASLAYLLKSQGYKVRIRKMDPYLNVDPGTMSPFQHGEVFVTDDGAEIDLDKIKPLNIFKWLKKNDINDREMLKTFNCGVGFCLIINPKNLKKINKFFLNQYKPYIIGKISKNKKKVILDGKINWL